MSRTPTAVRAGLSGPEADWLTGSRTGRDVGCAGGGRLAGHVGGAGPEGRVRIGGAKERLLLALLVLRAGEVVSRDALVDALWGGDPPVTAVKTLQGHVARVRRALEAVGLAGVLATRDPGYVLAVPADSVDVASFERHAAGGRGRARRRRPDAGNSGVGQGAAAVAGRRVLAHCCGGGWAAAEAIRLDELRISTVEDRIDADLMLGRHGVLVSELESLVARYPLRERLWARADVGAAPDGPSGGLGARSDQRARRRARRGAGHGTGRRTAPARSPRRTRATRHWTCTKQIHGTTSADNAADLAIPLPGRVASASSMVFAGPGAPAQRPERVVEGGGGG